MFVLAMGFATPPLSRADEGPDRADGGPDYNQDILPILRTYCMGCHVDDDASGGLSMESYAALMRGGEHGPALTIGEPASSRMLQMTIGALEPKMPPDDMEGPSEAELEQLASWIEAGARGPGGDAPLPSLSTPKLKPQSDLTAPITALAASPNGNVLATGSFEVLTLKEATSEKPLHRVTDLPGKVNDVAFSADGKRLAIASGITGLRGQVTLVDVETGKTTRQIDAHRDAVFSVAISPDGTHLATASYDATILIWDVATGQQLHRIKGHNGAIFDLQFSHDGKTLASASADETVKLWNVATGQRLDTLSQPQGEVWAVAFSPDDAHVVAASADQRLRVWQFVSHTSPAINPLLETRYADEAPLVALAFSTDGQQLIVGSQAGRLSRFETENWTKVDELEPVGDAISQLTPLGAHSQTPDAGPKSNAGPEMMVATLNGSLHRRALAPIGDTSAKQDEVVTPVYLVLESLETVTPDAPSNNQSPDTALRLPRGAVIDGVIETLPNGHAETDWYRFTARAGEVWMIETNASRSKSPLDTIIEVGSQDGSPLTRVRLQAIRKSYFTFRGKDSTQSSDFRLFGWEEMRLNDLLYSSGEVTRLWMYPRGPDSGFNVYPGRGARTTFFDTTPITHALQEPAYVVRPLAPGEQPASSGLPVFELHYVNDDDASRRLGTDSRLRFVAPHDGEFTIRVNDTRGQSGPEFKYKLTLRPAAPDFKPALGGINKPIPAGSGREFRVSITREDGFDGPVEFEIRNVPDGLHVTSPVVVEAGQTEAYGAVWCDSDTAPDQDFAAMTVVARAKILGRTLEYRVGALGPLKSSATGQIAVDVFTQDGEPLGPQTSPLVLRRGETIQAEVRLRRQGFDNNVSLGKEFAGRNMPHGVYVDNIGLNGLLVPKGTDTQQFFITADPVSAPGRHLFHLKAEVDGGITSVPIAIEIR